MTVLHYVCLISTEGLVGGGPAKRCWMMMTYSISRDKSICGTGYQKQEVNHFHFVTLKTELHCFLSVAFEYVWLNLSKLPSGVLGFCKQAWCCCNSLTGPAGHVLLLAHLWHCRALCRTPTTTGLVCDNLPFCATPCFCRAIYDLGFCGVVLERGVFCSLHSFWTFVPKIGIRICVTGSSANFICTSVMSLPRGFIHLMGGCWTLE